MPRTFLLDIDGTINCQLKKDKHQAWQILEYQELPNLLTYHPFLSEIAPDDTIMSGSYRTDLNFDLTCIMEDAIKRKIVGVSLTDILTQIANDTRATIDHFLFGDIGKIKSFEVKKTIFYNKLPPTGSTWDEMASFYQTHRNIENITWFEKVTDDAQARAKSDYDKIIAMYSWLQHIAQKNAVTKTNPHEVMYYEDNHELLDELISFCNEHTDWIPEGINLKIHYYAPMYTQYNSPILQKEIQGTGKPHPYFVRVARFMSSFMLININDSSKLDKTLFSKHKERATQFGLFGPSTNTCTKKVIIRARKKQFHTAPLETLNSVKKDKNSILKK